MSFFLMKCMYVKFMSNVSILPWIKILQDACFLKNSWVHRHTFVVVLATPWTAAHQALLTLTISWSFLKLMTIELVMPSNHPILCNPLLLLPIIFPTIRIFSSKSTLPIKWQKYWSFSCSISPSNEYSGLISFRTVWLDLLAVQGTLKSLLQHHRSQLEMVSRPSAGLCYSTDWQVHGRAGFWKVTGGSH